ncbi:phage protein [Streptococcus pyogenes JRS4]|nr:phage protein [Streptococcus pyogenes JRS4]
MNAKPIAYPILGHFYLSNRNSRNRTDLQPLSLLTTSKVATLVLLAVNHKTPHIRSCLPLNGCGVASPLTLIETAGFEPARPTYHKITSLIVVKVGD